MQRFMVLELNLFRKCAVAPAYFLFLNNDEGDSAKHRRNKKEEMRTIFVVEDDEFT